MWVSVAPKLFTTGYGGADIQPFPVNVLIKKFLQHTTAVGLKGDVVVSKNEKRNTRKLTSLKLLLLHERNASSQF